MALQEEQGKEVKYAGRLTKLSPKIKDALYHKT